MTTDRPVTEPRTEAGKIIGCNHIAWGSVAECPYCGTVNDMVPKAVHREEVAEALATDRAEAAQGAAPRAEGLDWRDGPMAEGFRAMAGFPSRNKRTPGTCPYCGVMSPFPHDVTCPRAHRRCLSRPSDERVPEEEPR